MHRVLNHRFTRASFMLTSTALLTNPNVPVKCTEESNKKQSSSTDPTNTSNHHFDITDGWRKTSMDGVEFFKSMILTDQSKEEEEKLPLEEEESKEKTDEESNNNVTLFEELINLRFFGSNEEEADKVSLTNNNSFFSSDEDLYSMAWNFVKLSVGDREAKEKALRELIIKAREKTGNSNSNLSGSSIKFSMDITEVFQVIQKELTLVSNSLGNSFGHLELSRLFPTSLFYYFEHEDEVKNPSWKRRMHRFHSGVDMRQIYRLYDLLQLANLSYADTIEEIVEGFHNAKQPLELVFCDIDSEPNKPGHFVALTKDQSIWSSELQVIIVVRGTKTFADIMTDCVVDSVPYRGGKAHSGILESGKYIFHKHKNLLKNLKDSAKKRTIKLTLVGHSLGAGSATIAGLEFNDLDFVDVEVVGFGCPSLLSLELSKNVGNIVTTVISDSDMVPRMSAATVANALLDVMEYDWIPYARRDMIQAFDEVGGFFPFLKTKTSTDDVITSLDYMLQTYVKPTLKEPTSFRAKPELCPPGTCVHIYRDGSGVSASIAPPTFFQKIDITRRMIDDHMIPGGYSQIFLDLMRQYHRDPSFQFGDNNVGSIKDIDTEPYLEIF